MDASVPVGIRDEDARAVLAAIDPDETISFLCELVRAPSVNPPGDVSEAASACERPLVAAGFAVRALEHEPGKPNIVAEWGAGNGPTLCFNAHLDVVPIGDESAWSHPPFAAEIADGRIYGRGAGDDKASVTAQVMGAVALARSRVPLRGRLMVTEVADEETSGAGALHLIAEAHVRPAGVIVGEQTMNRVAIGEKGTAGVDIVVSGRVEGTIQSEGHRVTVNDGAHVKADILAQEIAVSGRVAGALSAKKRIALSATADVEGALSAPAITIAEGAAFHGSVETTAERKSKLQLAS